MADGKSPNLDALLGSLQALAAQLKSSHTSYARQLPTTNPDVYWHTVDCNLHTMVGERFLHDEVQTLELADATRVQYLASAPELCFFVDIPRKKGRVSYLYLDRSLQQKEAATFRNVAELVRALDERRAGIVANKDTAKIDVRLTSTLPAEPPIPVEEIAKIRTGMAAAIKGARGKIDVPVGPRSTLRMRPHGDALDALELQKALRLELGSDKVLEVVRLLRGTIDPAELDEFVAPMAARWADAEKKDAASRWLLLAAGELGGTQTASILGRFCFAIRSDSKAHAALSAVLDALGRMGTLVAAHEIFAVATLPSRYTKRRNEAKAVLERIAGRAGVSVETLLVQAVPRDPTKQDRDRVIDVQSRRLERLMVDGLRLPLRRWRTDFFEHPLLLSLCEKLVFSVFDAGALKQSFRPAGGKLLDAQGKELKIDDAAQVGIAHAVELDEARVLAEWNVSAQPFLQLQRPMRKLNERQAKTNLIHDFKGYRREWLHEQEWWGFKVDADYMSDVDTFAVTMQRDGKYIEAKLDGQGRICAIGMGKIELEYDTKIRDLRATPSDATPFGKLHPVSQSELLYALLGNVSASPARPAAAPTVKSTSRYPFAEEAKSSRSQCLVCEQKIEKGTVRVAVEREIKSDNFNGTGAGYLHPRCVRTFPELKDIADLDAIIRKNSAIPWPPS